MSGWDQRYDLGIDGGRYWRKPRRLRWFHARRRYWFALAFVVGYSMVLTPFEVVAPW